MASSSINGAPTAHPGEMGAAPMAPPGCRLELLQHDDDFDLYRVHESEAAEPKLARVLATVDAGAASVEQLGHEHALKDVLDAHWALRPLELVRWDGRPVLLLSDPGGVPLAGLLGRPMEPPRFLRIACSLAAALAQLHERGIVHKNIKPANVLVEPDTGAAHLTGFGIARQQRREHQALAPLANIAGTLAYMAPEQTGRMNRSIDSRSDLYSLGVSLYEMLTGVLPFSAADPMELFHCHLARQAIEPAELVEDVPPLLSAIVMKLLSKAADDRYQTASGLAADLRRCLAQWQAQGRIDAFSLGTRDVSAQLLMPEKLYGRETEIAVLAAAFDRVAADGAMELVLVSGYSGIGKSSVVNELHKLLFPRRGLFAAGKFDQYKRDIPYATLAEAFRALVRQILGQNEIQLHHWQDALSTAVGPNGALVIKLVPELEFVIGSQPPVQELTTQDAQKRFQTVFRRFIGVFAQSEHPLVLFFDDLQWLDSATLDLLEQLFFEPGLKHLLVIGAFRDNEVDALHPLMRTLAAIRRAEAVHVQEIVLAPLGLDDVKRLVADTLHCAPERALGLAKLVHEKTGGNPFFTFQFITALAEERLIAFEPDAAAWTWELAAIAAKRFTDNVVDLMVDKLGRLPPATQSVLKLLGCMGSNATAADLSRIRGAPLAQIHSALQEAVDGGLVYRSDLGYAFLHDRIQEAAYSLIPPKERALEHLRLGRLLASHTGPQPIEDRIFEIVNQYNRGADLISLPAERERLAELNLIAGQRAKDSTAYGAALNYLATGCALLAPERGDALAFSLRFHRAECEYLTGDLACAEEHLALLTDGAASQDALAAVTCVRVNLFTTLDRCDRAVQVGLDYLRKVGVEWSPHPNRDDVRQEFERIWRQLGAREIEELVDLPLMSDADSRRTMDVLTTILPPTLFTDENLLGLVVGRMANISLEHGHSDGSCIGYAWLGMFLGPRFGNYEAGFRFGRLGLDLVEKRGLDRFKARVYVHFGNVVNPWTRPFHTGIAWVRHAFEIANRNGDLTFEVYSCNHLITNLLASGEPLAEIQREAENGLAFAHKARFGLVVDIITAQLQLIRSLRGLTPRVSSFDDAEFNEERFERHLHEDSRLAIAACWYWIRKLQARVFAGDPAGALNAAAQAQPLLWTSPSHVEVAEYHFYAALAHAAHCTGIDAEQQGPPLAALAIHHRQLHEWARNCPENFANREALVGAEIARIEGRELDAMRLYEQAVGSAHANGLVHNEALAYELAAAFYRQRGFDSFADTYLRQARDCYARWGADGKVRQLEARYAQLQPRPQGDLAAPLAQLDVQAVAKASQAISGRIVLDELVDTLLRIVLENAGAQSGYLLLARDEGLTLAAQAKVGPQQTVQVQLHLGTALPEPPLPRSVLNLVRRSHAPVLLADAAQPNPFSADPCWSRRQPKSVLCLPILRQSTLLGLLYLENDLLAHAFMPQRLTVLELLAAQAAISLENAILYADLQLENRKREQAEATLRERESRIRRLVEANIIGVCFWNLAGDIADANDAFLRLFGYSRQDLLRGAIRWVSMTPPEHSAADARSIAELQQCGTCVPYEKELMRKDGQRIPVLVGSAFLEGSREHGVAFVLDLSERRRAEAEREARQVADAANRAKSAFLATMSHELRTPLNAILGYAQLLKFDKSLDERKVAGLNTIQSSGEHLLTMINDILDVSRIEAGKIELQPEPVALPQFLQAIADIIRIRTEEKGLSFRFDSATGLAQTVLVDAQRLRQVLLNLLSNAVKFTDQGRVELRVRALDEGGDGHVRLRFEVEDSGIGIAPEQLKTLFEPFTQAAGVQRRFGGTGLGLSISRRLVRLMGSDIHVDSRAGAGSRFWLELRLPTLMYASQHEPTRVQPRATGYAGARRTLLVVDEVAANRRLLSDLLSSVGFSTQEADSGEAALQQAQALSPDLIVMDGVMPGIDGLEVMRRLRQLPALKQVPIIIVSASASLADQEASLASGAAAFLTKPIDLHQLLNQIGTLLHLSWIPDVSALTESSQAEATGPLVPPPQAELEVLYQLARTGNMPSIRSHAQHIEALGAPYGPLAKRLRELADGYQSRAILELVRKLRDPQTQG